MGGKNFGGEKNLGRKNDKPSAHSENNVWQGKNAR